MTPADDAPPPVRPALTPEEWSHAIWSRGVLSMPVNFGHSCEGGIHYLPTDPEFAGERRKIAALCLYGQEYGFTRDDVVLCESVARDIVLGLKDLQVQQGDPTRDEEQDSACDTLDLRLRSLAARIAALLPPEDQTP